MLNDHDQNSMTQDYQHPGADLSVVDVCLVDGLLLHSQPVSLPHHPEDGPELLPA